MRNAGCQAEWHWTYLLVGESPEVPHRYGASHVLDRHGSQDVVLESIRAVVGDVLITRMTLSICRRASCWI